MGGAKRRGSRAPPATAPWLTPRPVQPKAPSSCSSHALTPWVVRVRVRARVRVRVRVS